MRRILPRTPGEIRGQTERSAVVANLRRTRGRFAVSTGQIPPPEPEAPKPTASAPPPTISEYMSAIGRKGGQIGGKRRFKTMTKEQRSKIAARARWKKSEQKN